MLGSAKIFNGLSSKRKKIKRLLIRISYYFFSLKIPKKASPKTHCFIEWKSKIGKIPTRRYYFYKGGYQIVLEIFASW